MWPTTAKPFVSRAVRFELRALESKLRVPMNLSFDRFPWKSAPSISLNQTTKWFLIGIYPSQDLVDIIIYHMSTWIDNGRQSDKLLSNFLWYGLGVEFDPQYVLPNQPRHYWTPLGITKSLTIKPHQLLPNPTKHYWIRLSTTISHRGNIEPQYWICITESCQAPQ